MNPIYNTFIPDGFSTVNAYLFSENPQELIDFLTNAFYAEELNRTVTEDGMIANVIMKVGHSCFMISTGRDQFAGMRTSFYLFCNDVDGLHQRALEHGAKEEIPPMDMDYGDRQSGIVDPSGNYWWISQRLVQDNYVD